MNGCRRKSAPSCHTRGISGGEVAMKEIVQTGTALWFTSSTISCTCFIVNPLTEILFLGVIAYIAGRGLGGFDDLSPIKRSLVWCCFVGRGSYAYKKGEG
jgi:hypothetical protein